MNSYFLPFSLNNKPTVIIFVLCSYLLQVQTKHDGILAAVFMDLKKIITCSEIDASLYTAEITDRIECKESVMECFILEMEVILFESQYRRNKTFTNTVLNVLKNVKDFRDGNYLKRTESSTCQKCETFGEKTCTEFLKSFEVVLQQLYSEQAGKKQ